MSDNENIDYLLISSRLLAGEATVNERLIHEHWVAASGANKKLWLELKSAWDAGTFSFMASTIDIDAGWQKVSNTIKQKEKKSRPWHKLPVYQYAIAGCVLIALALLPVLINLGNRPESKTITFLHEQTPEVLLCDKTLITLNNGSSLTAMQPFKKDERRVILTGEAFFEVTTDNNRPFIIETGDLIVAVLGTSFNIRPCEETGITYIDVNSGLVKVHHDGGPLQATLVEAGQRVIYNKHTRVFKSVKANQNAASWKTREIRFNNNDLSEVIETLEHVYDVRMEVNDETILTERFGATFSNQPLNHVINIICLTFNLSYKEIEGTILLERKN